MSIRQGLAAAALTASMFFIPSAANSADVKRTLVRKGPVQIEVLEQGKGKAIVILPSLGRSAKDYDMVAQYLAKDGFRVIRPEPRGVENRQGPLVDLTLHDFADDVAMVMDDRRTGPAIIVGHAWGSQPARMLAVDRPDLVRGVVMAAASVGKLPPGSTEKPYGRLRDAIDGSGNPKLPREQRLTYLKQAFFAPGNDPSSWLGGWYHDAHDAQAHARNVTPIDAYFSAGGTVPILDLQGEHDAVVVKNVLQALVGDRVETKVIAGSGHAMAPERPKEMADAIAAFANRVYATSSQSSTN